MNRRWRTALAALVLVALVFAVYLPGRGGGFIFDDLRNVQRNPALLAVHGFDAKQIANATFSSSERSTVGRPLAMFTFALNQATTGPDPVPMKLTNIALHAFNALLVALLVWRLLALPAFATVDAANKRWATVFVALAWALHPLHVTAVLYLVQRMEVLAHTFVFAGLLVYVEGRLRQTPWLALTGLVAGTLLGGLSKESAALLPLYALCLELCVIGVRSRAAKIAWSALVIAGVAVSFAWLLPRVLPVYAGRDFTLVERLLTESRVLLEYWKWSLFPLGAPLGLFHDDIAISRGLFSPPATAGAILVWVVLVIAAVKLRARRPLVALGIAWFLAAHVLTGTIIPLEIAYEHRNYFAVLGVCLLLADPLLLSPVFAKQRREGALLACAFVAMFAGVTAWQSWQWRDPLTFVLHQAQTHPNSPRAQFEAARALVRLTRYDPRSPLMPAAWAQLERARATSGSGVLPHQSALTLAALSGTPQPDAWWDDLIQRLRVQHRSGDNLTALVALGDCAATGPCRFPQARMVAMYEAALSAGRGPVVLASYGKYALYVMNDAPMALRLWTEAVQRTPNDGQLRYNRARLLLDMGRPAEARAERDTLARQGRLSDRPLIEDLDARLQDAPPR